MLHLLAMAHSARVDLSIQDFEQFRKRIPVLCDLKPSGRFVATDLHAAGGSAVIAQRLAAANLLSRSAPTVSGRTIGERQ